MASEDGCVGGGNGRQIQAKKQRKDGWTKARRTTFLKVLAESCNVRMAARAVGMTGGAYKLRHTDPAFALLWDEALAIGYDRLETMLLQRALAGINDIDVCALAEESDAEAEMRGTESRTAQGDGEPDAAAAASVDGTPDGRPGRHPRPRPGSGLPRDGLVSADVQLALALLNRRRNDGKTRQNNQRKRMTSDEVDALLLKKLDALARKQKCPE